MHRKESLRLSIAALAVMLGNPAEAINTQFYAQTPLAQFSKAERQHHLAMLQDVLDNASAGEKRSWGGDKAGAEAFAEEATSQQGMTCRALTVNSWHRTLRATNTFNVCKSKDGKWKLGN